MSWTSSLAIFFVIWWIVLFAVLPFGVRNAHETGERVEDGHEAGAPVRHGLGWKVIVTTGIAAIVFALVYGVLLSRALEHIELPFIPDVKD
jgi:predicted secreted protein